MWIIQPRFDVSSGVSLWSKIFSRQGIRRTKIERKKSVTSGKAVHCIINNNCTPKVNEEVDSLEPSLDDIEESIEIELAQ
jgi:hypothetical protein